MPQVFGRGWKSGDQVRLRVTGCVPVHLASCIEIAPDGPVFRITDDPSWLHYTLKPGDYVLIETPS